ncbi:hypothetical protein CAEBREN_07262 [Caenorhabditis brenneri]|uniref:Uncharacterized protein n=1 Tax=Caenorhabditis brenneri TaxID=135651 RepID=G0NZP3_CAEBE|nr:hypothetical protein CAEBREN_07262 [Caenorhabditis brenneri]
MASIEMHSFTRDMQPLMEEAANNFAEEKVNTAFGQVKVSIYGDRKDPKKVPMITFHDLGLDSESNFQNFFQFVSIAEFADKFCIYNVNAPGQEMDAQPLPENFQYPTMDGIAKTIESVADHFKINQFIGFGVGVGANVLLRYAAQNQNRVIALILVNCCSGKSGWVEWGYEKWNASYLRKVGMTKFTVDYLMWHHFGRNYDRCSPDIVRQYRVFFQHLPNPNSLAEFIESYIQRTPLPISRDGLSGVQLKVPVLQLVGAGSAHVEDTVEVNTKLDPAHSDWIKISDSCGLVLDDRPDAVTESMMLFLQGLGYFPTLNVMKMTKKMQETQNGGGFAAVTSNSNECQ